MSEGQSDAPKARPLGLTAFHWGVIVGALLPFVFALGWHWLTGPSLGFNVRVVSRGEDVSAHGGAKVVISDEHAVLTTQTCNGPCDDLWVNTVSGDNAYSVHVFDTDGRCVTCRPGAYVTNGLVSRFTVSGDEKLSVEVE
jgi:hypothetical protein